MSGTDTSTEPENQGGEPRAGGVEVLGRFSRCLLIDGVRAGVQWGHCLRVQGYLGDDKNVLKLTMEIVTQFCEYSKMLN